MQVKHDFLFEIGTEELPPKALPALAKAFQTQVVNDLSAQKLTHGAVKLYYTPRRIALLVEQLDNKQPQQEIERKGPSVKAAYDADGKPTQALQGFLKSCQAKLSDIKTLKTDKGEWVVYRSKQSGQAAKALLPDICQQALAKLPIPKMMRWGTNDFEFVRPVHWLVMLLDDKVVPATLFKCRAGNQTYGHRFHHSKPITITTPAHYVSQLQKTGKVLADPEKRKATIRQQIQDVAQKAKAQPVLDESLLDEVNNLVEWPRALLCQFDKKFLNVPQEALISSMQSHQKSFAVTSGNKTLMPYFITISNLQSRDEKAVVHGNEKVMAARLADAAFFYEQDLKTPLADRLEGLNQITFQRQLGSLGDKVQHIHALALEIAKQLRLETEQVAQAALLCKCDLLTNMVLEFPELQGVMGKYYAKHEGLNDTIADAIEDHYKPRFSGDALARSNVGNAVAIADKITTLVGIFGIGQKPTGTKDPYKLRRAAIGLLRIVIENRYHFNLQALLQLAAKQFGDKLTTKNTVAAVFDYIIERLRVWYQEQGLPHGVIESVLAGENDDLTDIDARIHAMNQFTSCPEAAALAAANKRVHNILCKNTNGTPLPPIDDALLMEPAEKELLLAIVNKLDHGEPMLQRSDYQSYLTSLAELRQPVDNFFDEVMVMANDDAVKHNRLALLYSLRQLFCRVADMSKL